MSNAFEPDAGGHELQEQLVAYLDGELESAESQRVEELIARDPTVRDEVARFDRTWELLDGLPTAEVDKEFTHTTVEMIALTEAGEARDRDRNRARLVRKLMLATALFVAAAGGYLVAGWTIPDQNPKLLRDLPVLENLDDYRQVGDIEFLRGLKESGLFDEEQDRES